MLTTCGCPSMTNVNLLRSTDPSGTPQNVTAQQVWAVPFDSITCYLSYYLRRWAKCTSAGQMPVYARVDLALIDLASASRQITTINRAPRALQSMPRPQSSMICRISPQCPLARTRPTVSVHTIPSVTQSVRFK